MGPINCPPCPEFYSAARRVREPAFISEGEDCVRRHREFCERFLQKRDRTVDQMVHAARSGKQNILEGSQASGTSKETEIKLINVARASLEELLQDYRDFLRVRKLRLWDKNSREARFVRRLGSQKIGPMSPMRPISRRAPPGSSLTSSSASSTRRTTSSTNSSANWKKRSSKKAASASA